MSSLEPRYPSTFTDGLQKSQGRQKTNQELIEQAQKKLRDDQAHFQKTGTLKEETAKPVEKDTLTIRRPATVRKTAGHTKRKIPNQPQPQAPTTLLGLLYQALWGAP